MTIIAIDGPAGAGKSSIAKAVAEALSFSYVDTGAMYRTIALAAIDRGTDPADQGEIERLAAEVAPRMPIHEAAAEPLAARLRSPEVDAAASVVARYPGVREALAARQHKVALGSNVVMEGRDIGTVIAPEAEVKIYLTASPQVRAVRRGAQLGLPADDATLARIRAEIEERDHTDSVRADSPLKPAADAIRIDSSDRDRGAVIEQVLDLIRQRLHAP